MHTTLLIGVSMTLQSAKHSNNSMISREAHNKAKSPMGFRDLQRFFQDL